MGVENLKLEYPFIGYLNCNKRNNCSLNLDPGRGPCWLAAEMEGNAVPITAKNPGELRGKVDWYEKHAPCNKKGGTRCEKVEDGQVVRGTSVRLEWEGVKLSQEALF